MSDSDRTKNLVASVGLAFGAVFGLAGTLVTESNLQSTLWAIDSCGLVLACALLTLKFFRKGSDIVASGFLVFAIGEAVMLSETSAGVPTMIPAFAAGTALWATALMLISIPREFSGWIRVTGFIASILFAITSLRIFWGDPVGPTASPLPFFAYPFLVLTFIGWIWTLLKENRREG
jgi:hypothetical protein